MNEDEYRRMLESMSERGANPNDRALARQLLERMDNPTITMANGAQIVGIDSGTNSPTFRGQGFPVRWADEIHPAEGVVFSPDVPLGGVDQALERAERAVADLPTLLPQGPAHPNYQRYAVQFQYTPDDGETWMNNDETESAVLGSANGSEEIQVAASEPFGEMVEPYLAAAIAEQTDRIMRQTAVPATTFIRTGLEPQGTTFNFGGTVNEGAEARLVREARHTMEMEVNRAFQRTRNRPDTYERQVAVETPNGVLFIHLNYQPNPVQYGEEGE